MLKLCRNLTFYFQRKKKFLCLYFNFFTKVNNFQRLICGLFLRNIYVLGNKRRCFTSQKTVFWSANSYLSEVKHISFGNQKWEKQNMIFANLAINNELRKNIKYGHFQPKWQSLTLQTQIGSFFNNQLIVKNQLFFNNSEIVIGWCGGVK